MSSRLSYRIGLVLISSCLTAPGTPYTAHQPQNERSPRKIPELSLKPCREKRQCIAGEDFRLSACLKSSQREEFNKCERSLLLIKALSEGDGR